MDIIWILCFLLLGGFVGFIAGLLGVGGGAVMVPILTIIFIHMGIAKSQVVHLALGTAMMSIIATSFASTWAHQKHRAINWHVVKWLSPGVILGTFSGTFFVVFLNTTFLSLFFSTFVFLVAIKLLRKPKANTIHKERSLPKAKFISCAGAIIGAVSSLVSIGGGSLTVPYLIYFNLPMNKAVATSAAAGFVIAVAGSLGYLAAGATITSGDALQFNHIPYTFGAIYFPAVLLVSLVSIFTARVGANLSHRMPVAMLKKIFGILLLMLGANMMYNLFIT